MKVVTASITVLLSKLKYFHDLQEENSYRLSDHWHMSDLIPFVLMGDDIGPKRYSLSLYIQHMYVYIAMTCVPFV